MSDDPTPPPHVPPEDSTDEPPVVNIGEAAASQDTDSSVTGGSHREVAESDTETAADSATVPQGVWEDYFPFESAYPQQEAGIETLITALATDGYLALEGACGTGKTMLSLVGGIASIREADQIEQALGDRPRLARLVAITPIKSQLAQFVTEARAINRALPADSDPVTTLVLRGKTDLVPYATSSAGDQILETVRDDGESTHDTIGRLRETTRTIVDSDSPIRAPQTDRQGSDPWTGQLGTHDRSDILPDNLLTESGSRGAGTPTRVDVSGVTQRHNATGAVPPGADTQQLVGVSKQGAPLVRPNGELVSFNLDPRRAAVIAEYLEEQVEQYDILEPLVIDGRETPFPSRPLKAQHVLDIAKLAAGADDAQAQIGPGGAENLPSITDESNPLRRVARENFNEADETEVDEFEELPELLYSEYLPESILDEHIPSKMRGHIDPFSLRPLQYEETGEQFVDPAAAPDSVVDRDALIDLCATRGICPHKAMVATIQTDSPTLYLGNYYHVFDPTTRQLTAEATDVLSPRTGLIVDEAHELVDRVRDILSDTLSYMGLERAINDIDTLADFIADNNFQTIEELCGRTREAERITESELAAVEELFTTLQTELCGLASEHIRADDYLNRWANQSFTATKTEELPLEPPTDVDIDTLKKRLISEQQANDDFEIDVRTTAEKIEHLYEVDPDLSRSPQVTAVADFVFQWMNTDHTNYFRHIELEPNNRSTSPTEAPDWMEVWEPRFSLYNCLPKNRLATHFNELAGGVLMSATLEPLDVFTETVGLQQLTNNSDVERPLYTEQYPLAFPEENRRSYTVSIGEYIRDNRGRPVPDRDAMTTTRSRAAGVLTDLARSHGNILLALPSYREAEWAVTLLRDDPSVTKPILQDESSDEPVTAAMLDRFFEGDAKVLVTSARGTVTTGVDYDGDKLHTVGVLGVPYPPSQNPTTQATLYAYEQAFEHIQHSAYDLVIGIPTIRKVRQAFGRAIRATDERGTRVLIDDRYSEGGYRSVSEHLSEQEQDEFTPVQPQLLAETLEQFWGR